MIKEYSGNILSQPVPLELSLNRCSNRCEYCFSNLNNYKRKGDINTIIRFLNRYKTSPTLEARYLADGYPICLSNHSDPFSMNNYRETLILLEIFSKMGIDIFFQTKGGKGIEDALTIIKKSIWYFTICSLNDDVMNKIEPGAPLVSKRFKMIEKIIASGHDVIVGINPAVKQWHNGKEKELLKKIKEMGVYGVIILPLHFSSNQTRRVKNRKLLEGLLKTKISKDYLEYIYDFNRKALDAGLEIDDVLGETRLYDIFQKYYKCMPLRSNFINFCFQNKKQNETVTFTEFVKNVGGVMPSFPISIRNYARSIAPQFTHRFKFPKRSNFEDYLKFVWNSPDYPASPCFLDYCSIVVKNDLSGYIYGDDGQPIARFNAEGFKTFLIRENGEEVI